MACRCSDIGAERYTGAGDGCTMTGKIATAEEVAGWDIDVRPDGLAPVGWATQLTVRKFTLNAVPLSRGFW